MTSSCRRAARKGRGVVDNDVQVLLKPVEEQQAQLAWLVRSGDDGQRLDWHVDSAERFEVMRLPVDVKDTEVIAAGADLEALVVP